MEPLLAPSGLAGKEEGPDVTLLLDTLECQQYSAIFLCNRGGEGGGLPKCSTDFIRCTT